MREFELIAKYFHAFVNDPAVLVGIGDDGAILAPTAGKNLVVVVDTMVCGTHYLPDTPAEYLAEKALAVNLSDIAAMGAVPKWFTLALTMQNSDAAWLQNFSAGLARLAQQYQLALVGGDTTSGPESVTIQIIAEISPNQALLRSGAKPGDLILVSGDLGAAAAGLLILRDHINLADKQAQDYCCARLQRPTPRIALGQALLGVANSAIDISDGLLADLGHILESSNVGATIQADKIPVAAALNHEPWTAAQRLKLALTGGDDYELCFTATPQHLEQLQQISALTNTALTVIGECSATPGLRVVDTTGAEIHFDRTGWQHFEEK